MAIDLLDLPSLADEYSTILAESEAASDPESLDRDQVVTALVQSGDWTVGGAEAILSLAINYGTFMLRNALALASALEIQDGELGY